MSNKEGEMVIKILNMHSLFNPAIPFLGIHAPEIIT